jgi:hypothetical protein
MAVARAQRNPSAAGSTRPPNSAAASPSLEWLWHYLRDVPHPHVLDCGAIRAATANLLLKRGAKLYVADLITSLQRQDPAFWERKEKQLIFRTEAFLAQAPVIPAASLNLILCWHLLDLVPREGLGEVVKRLFGYLEPGGVMVCLLREPNLAAGVDTAWWLESLTVMQVKGSAQVPFPYPAITNRDMERLVPTGSVKTFLTRTQRREIVIVKQGGLT